MKKINIILLFFVLCLCLYGCGNKTQNNELSYEEQSIYSDSDTISILLSNNNYFVLETENDIVTKTSYVYHYISEEEAKQMYEAMKDDLDEKYSSVKYENSFLYLEYSEKNPDSLNGLSKHQIELLYADGIVKSKGE